MTIPTAPRTSSLYHASELAAGSVFSAGKAIVVFLVTFVAFFFIAGAVGLKVGLVAGVVVGELVLVLVPLAFVRGSHGTRAMLGLRRPEARFLVAALLLGSSQWFLNLVIVDAIDSWLHFSKEGSARLEQVAVDPHLAISLLAVALAPAVCEEVLFRGVVARGLATRFVPAVAILVSAVLFSAFHLSVIQAVPTFLLGLVYGYITLAARSCVPTMLAHLVNNSLAILVAQGAVPWLTDALGYNLFVSCGVALALTTSGLVLAVRSPRE